MTGPDGGQRLLLVHAHPDDESIGTGATMAKYAAEGAGVTLITCTLGELGEIIPPELKHLAADADGGLGEYRIGELAEDKSDLSPVRLVSFFALTLTVVHFMARDSAGRS